MKVDFRYTRHQVARRAKPDARQGDRLHLIKNVSFLRATYQIRLLAFTCQEAGQKLVLSVPKGCRFAPDLLTLVRSMPKTIVRESL